MTMPPYIPPRIMEINSREVKLTKDEADTLKNHLESSILAEIRSDEYYDNFGYLRNLIHIYEKCKETEQWLN